MYAFDRVSLGAETAPEAPEPVPSISHVNQSSSRDRWLSIIPSHSDFVPPLRRSTFRSVDQDR
ncbi:MAG: hypothetical protein JWO01_2728 [Microbacteriaceae bacterium]|jgi:hypothetical protein|nr:hypothetical protein [Microbacteriaceae bacterium]